VKIKDILMDKQTINVYDSTAIQIAGFHNTLTPKCIYYLINKFFIGGGRCGDIGCGIGRDASWLIDQGFDVVGIDGSIGMLKQARSHYPNIQFIYDSLPLLARQGDASFVNLLCSAVIMHLPREQIPQAVKNILRVVRIEGIIILSFRGSSSPDFRENGKLYTPISSIELQDMFCESGADLLNSEIDYEDSRNFTWNNLVFKKFRSLAV
jgi:ubiquinone/menaquinone biosynthesis C-methylase UbiE